MLGSEAPFSSWANQPFEMQNRLSPLASAMRRLACSTSRTVMLRLVTKTLQLLTSRHSDPPISAGSIGPGSRLVVVVGSHNRRREVVAFECADAQG